MTYLSRISFLDVLDLIRAGKVAARTALDLASCNQWLSRVPLSFRLMAISMLRSMV